MHPQYMGTTVLATAQIRGENFSQQAWQAGVHLINGHHSTLSNLHIIGQTGLSLNAQNPCFMP